MHAGAYAPACIRFFGYFMQRLWVVTSRIKESIASMVPTVYRVWVFHARAVCGCFRQHSAGLPLPHKERANSTSTMVHWEKRYVSPPSVCTHCQALLLRQTYWKKTIKTWQDLCQEIACSGSFPNPQKCPQIKNRILLYMNKIEIRSFCFQLLIFGKSRKVLLGF